MKKTVLILTASTLTVAAGSTAFPLASEKPSTQEKTIATDTVQNRQVHPVIKNTFYNLPLEKSHNDLCKVIGNDNRFISTATTFNNYIPSSFFKGITADKGLIRSRPDSIRVMLVYGSTPLATERGGQENFKNVTILNCRYFYSSKDSAEIEYGRILNMLLPIFKDASSLKDETSHPKFTVKTTGKFFRSFEPYYDVTILLESTIPTNGSKSVFGLSIEFRKENT